MKFAIRAFLRPLIAGRAMLRRLAERRDGNVAILFGLAAIPVVIAAGMALDTARAYMVKTRLGSALDAAALAVGSQSNQPQATLTTDLENYFYNNYCKTVPSGTTVTSCASTVAGETNITVTPTTSITAATVSYTASATVPMTFMNLVGVSQVTLTVSAQTTKFPGMEIAVVLDNTGSMLCNGAAQGPYYSPCGPTTSDTACATPGANPSRICTLIPAAQQFVTTIQNAITGPESVYMSIVPYVTTVNVGTAFGCSNGSTSCSNLTGNPTGTASGSPTCSGFTDDRGNIIPVIPITGNTTGGSSTVSSISPSTNEIQAGMYIAGPGIPVGATVSSVGSSTQLTLSSNATLSYTGNALSVGPNTNSTSNFISTSFTDPTAVTTTGSWTSGSTTVTVSSTTGIQTGMVITDSSSGITLGTTVSSVGSGTVTLSAAATATKSNKSITFSLAGNLTSGSKTINFSGTQTTADTGLGNAIIPGMLVNDNSGYGYIPANTYVTAVNSTTQITISNAATTTHNSDTLTFTSLGGTTNSATNPNVITAMNTAQTPAVGMVVTGNGIPANSVITSVDTVASTFANGTGQVHICNNATAPSNFSSPGVTASNTALAFYTPVTYDSSYNSASPTGSSTSTNWGGCVVEPTSSDEMASGTGAIVTSAMTDPDTDEPSSGSWPSWYPFWWPYSSNNAWTAGSASVQDTATEIQGSISSYDTLHGPNQGCPAPMLALTDLTTTAGQTAINTAITNMWPRDSGGTQVHIGMIWGWRALSQYGPFAANNGHPMTYTNASAEGWKKIVVLMTDGTEEWPFSTEYTGLGTINDGKIGTTNYNNADGNLDTRLQNVCSSMAEDGIIIYTVGLGYDGQHNTTLSSSCPANGGFYSAATTSNLQSVFQAIANSIVHLRLTK
jgi:Flp pilus assembly protein TadG